MVSIFCFLPFRNFSDSADDADGAAFISVEAVFWITVSDDLSRAEGLPSLRPSSPSIE